MRPPRPADRRRVARRGMPAAWLLLAALLGWASHARAASEGTDDVVRVRIPLKQVGSQFPPGTPLRMLTAEAFETLLADVERQARERASGGPRLVRARHSARFSAGLLVGRSELVLSTPPGPSSIPIEPWTPAVLKGPESGATVAASASGETFVAVEPKAGGEAAPGGVESTVAIEWELRARPDSRGRIFALSLPGDETTNFTLDVPKGWEPSGAASRRDGPFPGEGPGREGWRFSGRVGGIDLRLTNLAEARAAGNPSRIYVGGPTRIDLAAAEKSAGRAANWTMDWSLQADEPSPGSFTVEVDPGLELLAVEGPAVREFAVQPGSPTRAVVSLVSGGSAATPVRFRGHARVPADGPWTVASIRPLPPLTWTGGTTTVVLDDRRVVRECREIDGRRIPPAAPDDSSTATVLAFEAASPGPAAELTFRAGGPEPPATVRGRLLLGESSARIECAVAGLPASGSSPERELEVPAGWSVDNVAIAGLDEPVAWNQSAREDGSSLLRVQLSTPSAATEGRTLIVGAASTDPAGRPATLALPRLWPSRGAIADEAWVATAPGSVQLVPDRVRGLAWIDAAQVPGLLPSPPAPEATAGAADAKPVLAWRWTSAEASATAQVREAEPRPTGWAHMTARVEPGGRKVDLSGWATTVSPLAAAPVRFRLDLAAGDLDGWSFSDAATGRRLAPTILAEADRRRLGLAGPGVALEFSAEPSAGGRSTVEFRAAIPWEGRGRLPLPTLPASHEPRGVAIVETPESIIARIEGERLARIEPSVAGRLAPGPGDLKSPGGGAAGTGSAAGWTTQASTYDGPAPSLTLSTRELTQLDVPGLIRDARLTTQAFPGGRSLNRLRLLVAADRFGSLTFEVPAGLVLAAARVDGTPAAPVVDGGKASIPLGGAGGEGTRAVELDYRVEPATSAAAPGIRPTTPQFNLPCLSFSWELAVPSGETVDASGSGFVVDAAEPRPSWPFGVLGVSRWRWPGERPAARTPGDESLRKLDELLGGAGADDLSFSEAIMRWDSGARPVVVDRSALSAEGVGPRSRFLATPTSSPDESPSSEALRRRGLTLLLVDESLVVTSQRAATVASSPSAWRSSIAEALLWGSDASDRFQGVPRWRGEPAAVEGPQGGPADRLARAPGWAVWRLVATSWPGADAVVVTTDAGARAAMGWAVAALLVGIGLWRAASPRRGLLFPLLIMMAAVVLHDWAAVGPPSLTAGAFVGSFGVLLVRLGRLVRATLRGSHPTTSRFGGGSTVVRRRGFRVASWWAAGLGLATASGAQGPEANSPIFAFAPYEGEFDPGSNPSQFILSQVDLERLQARSRPAPSATGGVPGPAILAAEHRISRGEDQGLVVVSEYELRVGGGASRFEFPVGDVRDIVATLDGERSTVIVAPGGESASVRVPSGPSIRLQIRRSAVATREGGLETLDLKVNRAPSAKLRLEQGPGSRPVQQLTARGRVVAKGDESIEAELGPVDRVGVCWTSPDPAEEQPSATVERLILWDVEPAGERVRARFTYRTRRRTSTIRIELEPGLVPRSVDIPGLVDATMGGTPQRPEWIARVDPPLPDRTTIFLDFWRPLRADAAAGMAARRCPRVEPRGVDPEVGLLAVRRPGHWSGRLEPPTEGEPVGDETFVRAWGSLPADGLTFAGAVRCKPQDAVEFRTGPVPTRWRQRPAVQVQVDSGRVDCRYEVEIAEITGLLDHVDLTLPDDLIVLGVESAGMTDWSRPTGAPLRLRFDRIDLKTRRTATIRGWIPVPQLDAATGPRQHRLRLPWIDSGGGAEAAGTLEILSRVPVELATAPGGAAALAAEATKAGDQPGSNWLRQAYRIDDPTRVGELRWASPPPRTGVVVDSQLTIHPDSAEWVAVLRYEVAGGPLDAIHLKIPSTWADGASLRLAGQPPPLTKESRDGFTFWTITPERPIWGTQRLVLRARRPIAPAQEVVFPEVVPLGNGVADTAMALVFATSRLPSTSGSAGLRQISYAGRFQDEEFGASRDLPARAYRVDQRGGSISIQGPGRDAVGEQDASARVRSVDVAYVLDASGGGIGSAAFQLEPRSGRFLTVAPPEGAGLIRAAVDGSPVAPLMDSEGRWMIPLGDAPASLVGLTWAARRPSTPSIAGVARRVALPRAGDGQAPALVSIYSPTDAALRPTIAGLQEVGGERLQLDRADRIALRARDLISEMDRSSGRDRGRLVSLLIDRESALRQAEHALSAASRSPDVERRKQAARDLEVVGASRAQFVTDLQATGLEEPIAVAREYLGLEPSGGGAATATEVPEQTDRERVRRLGRPAFFAGASPGLADPPAMVELSPDRATAYQGVSESRARSLLLLALLTGLGLAGLTSARQVGAQCLIAAAGLSLSAVAGGPLALIGCSLALAAGWTTKGPAPVGMAPST